MIIKLKLVLWSWLWAYRINKIRSLSKKHIKKKKELSPHFRSSLVLKYTKSLLKLYNVKVEIKGYENLQKTPAMVVANHASNADSLIIYSALEKQNKDEQDKENVLTFLAKKELENKKVTKWILQLIDTFFIDRKKIKESFTTLVDFGKFVRDKKTYGVVFPEGTRTEDGHIQNFKIGAFKIAKKQFLPIIPITINNSGRVFDSNRKEKLVVEVIIHKPIKAPFVASQPAEALALKAKNIIEQNYVKHTAEKELKKVNKMFLNQNLNIQIKNYDGPLDLLLDLVRSKKIEIKDVDVVELADQYIKIIDHLKDKNIKLASEYLVIAATLIYIKARALLIDKTEEVDEELEIDKNKILAMLYEYQQIKAIAQMLREQLDHRNNYYEKPASSYSDFKRKKDNSKLDGKSSQMKLIEILRMMFERNTAKEKIQIKTDNIQVNPEQQSNYVLKLLKEHDMLDFEQVFALPTLKHFSITLISVLEMAKKHILHLKQDKQFGDIKIYKGGEENEI